MSRKFKMERPYRLRGDARLAVFVSLAIFSLEPALAAGIISDGGAHVFNKGGVEVVNIVAPNQQGLSHNKYQQYNVNQPGAVLNNSVSGGQSVLAGQLAANGKLGGNAARLILNEVVGANPSLLLGKQEVFGMVADYVLANPNGITSRDGGFINTGRATLVVGTPVLQNGNLESLMIGNGAGKNNSLNVSGQLDGARVVDLLAPKIDVTGTLKSQDSINILSGRNEVRLSSDQGLHMSAMREITSPPPPQRQVCILGICVPDLLGQILRPVPSTPADTPAQVLDSRVLGSLESGRIRIYNTDPVATTTMQSVVTARDTLSADIAGKLLIEASSIQAGAADLRAGTLHLGARKQLENIKNNSKTELGSNGFLQDWRKDTDREASSEKISGSSVSVKGGVRLESRHGALAVEASTLSADRIELISSGAMDISSLKANTREHEKITSSGKDKSMQVVENKRTEIKENLHGSALKARDIRLQAGGQLGINAASIEATNALNAQASKVVISSMVTGQQLDTSSKKTDNLLAIGSLSVLTTHEESQADTSRNEQLHVSNLKAGNSLTLGAQGDVVVSGSKLIADKISLQGNNIVLQKAVAEYNEQHKERRADLLNIFNTDTVLKEKRSEKVEVASLSGRDISVSARNSLALSGAVQRESQKTETTYGLALKKDGSNFGHDRKELSQEKFVAAHVAGQNILLSAGGQMTLDGSLIKADNDVKLRAGKLNASTVNARYSDTADRHSLGLLNSVRDSSNSVVDKQHSTEVYAGNLLDIQAASLQGKGVILSGADVLLGGGDILLEHAVDRKQTGTLHREAAAFDLVQTSLDSKDTLDETIQGSLVRARQGDVKFNADQVFITASRVDANKNSQIISKNDIVLKGASEKHEQRSKTWRPSVDFYVSQEGSDWEKELGGKLDLKEVLESVLGRAATADEDLQFRLGLRVNGKTHEKVAQQIQFKESAVTAVGGQALLQSGGTVSMVGSRLQAAAGEASVQARAIDLAAGLTQRITEDNRKTDGVGPYISAGVNRVAAGADAVTFQYNVRDEDNKVAASTVAGKSVWLAGTQQVTTKGAQLRADGDVSVSSGRILMEDAQDSTLHQITQPRLGAEADIWLKYSPSVGASAAVYGKLDVARDFTTSALGTKIEGGSIRVRGNDVRDKGTVYVSNAGATSQGKLYNGLARGDVLIQAVNYDSVAAENSQYSTRDKVKGRFELQAYTSTFQDVTIKGILSGGARHEESGKSQAVKTLVTANNLNIEATNRAVVGSDTRLAGNYAINAGREAIIGQAHDRSWLDRQGFNASVGIGAKIFPAGFGATLPVINLKGDFNTLTIRGTHGVGADVSAANVRVQAGQLAKVEGANIIVPGEVHLSAAQARYDAAYGTHTANGISAGGSFDFAPLDGALGSLGVSADLDFIKENGRTGKGGSVKAEKMTLRADHIGEGAAIIGAKVTTSDLDISNKGGDVVIRAAESESEKANFGGGFKFGIGIDKKSLNSLTAGGRIDVDFDKVRGHDKAIINSQRINLLSGRDTALVGADVHAEVLKGDVGGNLLLASLMESQDRKRLLIDVALGGAPAKVETAKDGAGVVRDALLDGSLFGFSGHANIDAQYVDYVQTKKSQLRIGTLDLPVGGNVTVDAADLSAKEGAYFDGAPIQLKDQHNKDHRAGVTLNVSTNLIKMVQRGVDDIKAGRFPLINAHFKWSDSEVRSSVDL
jgi:hemolysin